MFLGQNSKILKGNPAGSTSGAGTAYPSIALSAVDGGFKHQS